MKKYVSFLVLVLFLASTQADAHCKRCATTNSGSTYCSKYRDGGIAISSSGSIYCGQGECVLSSGGAVYCSKYEGGGAAVSSGGSCYSGRGDCATSSGGSVYCSNVPGGWARVTSGGSVSCEGGCATGEYCVSGDRDLCEFAN